MKKIFYSLLLIYSSIVTLICYSMEPNKAIKDNFYTLVTNHVNGTNNNLLEIKKNLESNTTCPFTKNPLSKWKPPLQSLSLPKEFTCNSCIDYIILSCFGLSSGKNNARANEVLSKIENVYPFETRLLLNGVVSYINNIKTLQPLSKYTNENIKNMNIYCSTIKKYMKETLKINRT